MLKITLDFIYTSHVQASLADSSLIMRSCCSTYVGLSMIMLSIGHSTLFSINAKSSWFSRSSSLFPIPTSNT